MDYQPLQCETNTSCEGDEEEYIRHLQNQMNSKTGDDLEELLKGEVDTSSTKEAKKPKEKKSFKTTVSQKSNI